MKRLATGLVVLLIGCGGPGGEGSAASGGGEYEGGSGPGAPEGLPSHAPDRFGFGLEASPARVAMWDIDVKPDGEGLPRGSGSVPQGEQVFLTHCVACHGPTGTEGPNDRLVGTEPWEDWPGSLTVGGYWPYATTLFDFIGRAMPQLTPGVLTADQKYAVVAYVLYLNGIVPADAVMTEVTLPDVRMPARDRFVVDDRQGGPGEIR